MDTTWTFGDATKGITYKEENNKWSFDFKPGIWERVHLQSNAFPCEENKVYKFHLDADAGKTDYRITLRFFPEDHDARGYRKYVDFDDEIRVPEGMKYFEVKVIICSRENTTATLGEISYEYIRDHKPHNVRLCAISDCMIANEFKDTPKHLVNAYAEAIDKVAKDEKPDLVVLTEHYSNMCTTPIPLEEKFVPMDDYAVTMLSDKAKQYGMYVCGSVHILEDGNRYNRSLLFNREGELIAKYDKTHPTMNEIENGIVPGAGITVVDTDIGRIGMLICWDLWFPELVSLYYKENVDILINCSRGGGIPQAKASSYVSGMYIVASEYKEMNRVQDKAGEFLATTDDRGYAVATVDITEPEWVPYLAVGNNYGEGRNIYRKDRRPDMYAPIAEKY